MPTITIAYMLIVSILIYPVLHLFISERIPTYIYIYIYAVDMKLHGVYTGISCSYTRHIICVL